MKLQHLLLSILCVTLLAGLFWFFGSGYGKVSDNGYKVATALFSVCNRQDGERLEELERIVVASRDDGSLQPKEARWLQGIIGDAQRGKWGKASASVRRMMNAQIRPGPALPLLD